jgi:hypothetical protein
LEGFLRTTIQTDFSQIDKNKDGRVNVNEFIAWAFGEETKESVGRPLSAAAGAGADKAARLKDAHVNENSSSLAEATAWWTQLPLQFDGKITIKEGDNDIGYPIKIIQETEGVARWTGLNIELKKWKNLDEAAKVSWEELRAHRQSNNFEFTSSVCQLKLVINNDLPVEGDVVQQGKVIGHFFLRALPWYRKVPHGMVDPYMYEDMHAKRVDNLISQVPPNAEPWALWLAGGAGSGKGFVMDWCFGKRTGDESWKPSAHHAHLDVDAHRLCLGAWIEDNAEPKLLTTAARTQSEVGYINDTAMAGCARQRKSFVVDGTMRDHRYAQLQMDRMRELSKSWKAVGAKDTGVLKDLKIAIVFVDTTPETALRRARERAERIGRPVPEGFPSIFVAAFGILLTLLL